MSRPTLDQGADAHICLAECARSLSNSLTVWKSAFPVHCSLLHQQCQNMLGWAVCRHAILRSATIFSAAQVSPSRAAGTRKNSSCAGEAACAPPISYPGAACSSGCSRACQTHHWEARPTGALQHCCAGRGRSAGAIAAAGAGTACAGLHEAAQVPRGSSASRQSACRRHRSAQACSICYSWLAFMQRSHVGGVLH